MTETECGNPLLRDWIGEWMEEEKAYESISKCTEKFAHPSEAEKLHGIGKVIAQKLEKRMIEHCKANDMPLPVRTKGNVEQCPVSRKRGSTQDQGSGEGESESNSTKKIRRAPKKPYVPKYRSGPYAILLALMDYRDDNLLQATKEQIIQQAEDYCDSSFDMPEPGKNYTAWSSIKTLLEKDYVWKNGSPPKYMLTDSGYEMGKQLRSASENNERNVKDNKKAVDNENRCVEEEVDLSLYVLDPNKFRKDLAAETRDSQPISVDLDDGVGSIHAHSDDSMIVHVNQRTMNEDEIDLTSFDFDETPQNTQTFHTSGQESQDLQSFDYEYIDTEGKPVRHMTQAATEVDSKAKQNQRKICNDAYPVDVVTYAYLKYKIRFSADQRHHRLAERINILETQGKLCLGWIPEDIADPICPGLPATSLLPLHVEKQDDFWPNYSQPAPDILIDDEDISYRETQSQPALTDARASMTRYPPDSYEIVLVLDNREIKMKTNRDYILQKLETKGIRVVKRALELGDVIWIARKKGSNSPSDELFLDIVIERKRMDDLVSSIKDGRFREQKYRLQRSGAHKVIYVVEEYNKEEAERFGVQAIQTALSSTQVVDGFFLKRTSTIDDTIDYLVTVTKMVEKLYQNVTLFRIPEHLISRQDFLNLKGTYTRSATEAFVVTYPIYNQLNSKYGTCVLQDLYIRMLMTIRGVSVEKASALIKVYPTPHKLLQAMRAANEQDGKNLAKEATKHGISRRRWGASLSERLWQVWGAL
ncbi:Crossover junction endonuclease mus81 [Apophysomyces ossiformis]|uniref:Crossover junction endonuclease MUS81 n=1 Tax=Apophysomyces ossiformis TaxID=679940 RepID=A0A8H7BDM0_9FUNG|nr:Crossover junction endonuclease mus81 [Apophysomyces ossiformis]